MRHWIFLTTALSACAAPQYPGSLNPMRQAVSQSSPVAVSPAPASADRSAPEDSAAPAPVSDADRGRVIAEVALGYLGSSALIHDGTRYRPDCSGFVEAAYAQVGLDLRGSAQHFLDQAHAKDLVHHKKIPSPGDLAFFEETYDANKNGRIDDGLTHVAIVVDVDRDGNITMVHWGSVGVSQLRMNLYRPEVFRSEEQQLVNSYLRKQLSRDPPGVRYLSGQLWTDFASLWELEPSEGG